MSYAVLVLFSTVPSVRASRLPDCELLIWTRDRGREDETGVANVSEPVEKFQTPILPSPRRPHNENRMVLHNISSEEISVFTRNIENNYLI